MPAGSAALLLALALAWRSLVTEIARWQRSARTDRAGGAHGFSRHALAGQAGIAR